MTVASRRVQDALSVKLGHYPNRSKSVSLTAYNSGQWPTFQLRKRIIFGDILDESIRVFDTSGDLWYS